MDIQAFDKEISEAMKAHDAWSMRLTTAINLGECETTPGDIACDDKCAFGKWLYGNGIDDTIKAGKPYQVTRRLHADFHKLAGQVARLAEDGKKGEAYALLDGEYAQKSSKLLRALTKWRGELNA